MTHKPISSFEPMTWIFEEQVGEKFASRDSQERKDKGPKAMALTPEEIAFVTALFPFEKPLGSATSPSWYRKTLTTT